MATLTATRNWASKCCSNLIDNELNPLEEGATALMYACQQEDLQQLQTILRKKPDAVYERDRTLKTVLHYCAENVTLGCAEIILNAAPDIIDVADEDGYTTLHLAVIAGNIPLVNFLISKSAGINILDAESHSVIHWATVCGEVELLEILLKCKANPSSPDVHGGYPIHYAAQMCGAASEMANDSRLGLAVLKVLIKHDVDVNVVDHDGRQPVLWAASTGSSDAVIALINAGASVRAHDKDGLTALHCAASRGHTDCLETLIELCAADVDVIDNNGCSPLFYSVTLGHADATQLLLQCNANPNRQDRKGRTPAHCGAAKGQFETLKMLKKHDGNLWIKNAKGDYCLHEAVNSGRKELVTWLLSHRPDAVNASNSNGRCPIHIAAMANNMEMCKILLDYQSLVNPVMRTSKGEMMTPLDAALQKGNRGCAKYLQLHGGVPASKLTSFSAAIRGPHRIEAHSDYQGSPEGKLDPQLASRGSRSLDTSPSGYHSSNRKVQVRIRADVSSERLNSDLKSLERHRYRASRNRYSEKHKKSSFVLRKQEYENDSYSYSSFSDFSSDGVSQCSSDMEYKNHRRRRRRRRRGCSHHRSRVCSRSRSRSCCRCNAGEKDADGKAEGKANKVYFQAGNNKGNIRQKIKGEEDDDDYTPTRHIVTALVHEENEKQVKYSEDVNEKSKTAERLDNDHAKPESGSHELENREEPNRKSPVKLNHEGQKEKEMCMKFLKHEETSTNKEDKVNGFHFAKANDSSIIDVSQINEEIAKNSDTQQQPQSEQQNVEVSQLHDDNYKVSHYSASPSPATNSGSSSKNEHLANEEPLLTNVYKRDDKIIHPCECPDSGLLTAHDPNEGINTAEIVSVDEGNQVSKLKTVEKPTDEIEKSTAAVEELKQEKIEQHLTKDKGLICVILDDDETIEIKRRKDRKLSKSEYQVRTRSASRKKEKSLRRIHRHSKSSFEILSDETNNEDRTSRLTVHDDSGFEPSPRRQREKAKIDEKTGKIKSRIPRATNKYPLDKEKENESNINVSSVTQAVQTSLRKYHLERKVFHTLLELKRLQIRTGKSNEQVLVKRLVDDYQKAGLIVGLRSYDGVYSFKHFEKYLYEQLRILQFTNRKDIPRVKSSDDFDRLTRALKRTKAGKTLLENVPDNPLFCTHGTHRCLHATHAYTGIPCAAYIARLDHHQLPKPNQNYRCFLPRIADDKNMQRKSQDEELAKLLTNVDPSKPVTLELIHGEDKQIISLPTEKLDKNKRYYVTFTIKGDSKQERLSSEGEREITNQRSDVKTAATKLQ